MAKTKKSRNKLRKTKRKAILKELRALEKEALKKASGAIVITEL